MIQWQKYFDKIICINYVQFKTRKELMEFQLNRVGILNSPVFEWLFTYQGPYEEMQREMLDPEHKLNSLATFSCMMGHLNAVKKAFYSGCKNVLILEDDARFLRDLDLIEKILQNRPKEDQYDLIMYDKFITDDNGGYKGYKYLISNKEKYINEYYIRFTQNLLSAACYELNRTAMQIIITLSDSEKRTVPDYYFNYKELNSVWKKVCLVKNLAVQAIFMSAENFNRFHDYSPPPDRSMHFQHVYRNQDLNFDDYMMRKDGSKYGYGDYIPE